jgi:DNA-binding transcriptional LysR family regulator
LAPTLYPGSPVLAAAALRPDDRLVLVVPARHPLAKRRSVAFADAADYDFVSLTEGTSLAQRLALESRQTGKPLRIRIRVRSFDAMGRMVAAGLGLAVLPRQGAAPYAHALGLHIASLQGLDTQRRLLMAMRDLATLSGAAEALVKMAQQRLQALQDA